jgi:hypothetical protein
MKKDEKELSLDEFKEAVYKAIGLLESMDETHISNSLHKENKGCFGIFILPFLGGFVMKTVREARNKFKIKELGEKADEIMARPKIKDLICSKVGATTVLPIDAAYRITPSLHKLALKEENDIPVNSLLFAIICRKITQQGVANYCAKEK